MEEFLKVFSNFELCPREIAVASVLLIVSINLLWAGFQRKFPLKFFYNDTSLVTDKKTQINKNRKIKKGSWNRPDFPNGWFAIIESINLEKQAATEAIICGKEVVVWRGENGVAYVADAYCPHLGAHLGVEGEVKGNCIQCPFHNWQFDGSQAGKLTCIPYSQKVVENIHLKMWPSLERNGFIWTWYHVEGMTPSWEPPCLLDTKSYHVLNVLDTMTNAHPQDISENGADYSHLNVVHGNIFPTDYSLLYSLMPISILWNADWQPESHNDKIGHIVKSVVHLHFVLFGKWSLGRQHFTLTQYGPGMVVSETSSSLGSTRVVFSLSPITSMKTRSIQKAFCSNIVVYIFQWFFKFAVADQVFRDTKIWNRLQFNANPTLVKEDAAIKTFRKWYSQFYCTNCKESATGISTYKQQ